MTLYRRVIKDDAPDLRDYFSWNAWEGLRFRYKHVAVPCTNCDETGACPECNGIGCDWCIESDEWGDCVECNGTKSMYRSKDFKVFIRGGGRVKGAFVDDGFIYKGVV